MSNLEKTLLFERSSHTRYARAQAPRIEENVDDIPESLKRKKTMLLPEVSELQVVRHFSNLPNFSIDTHFYPLGSCTMKYNPRGIHRMAMDPHFLYHHPLIPASETQGYLQCLYELQELLKEITGMGGVALSPMAGAQGEFVGVAMIKAYHDDRGDYERTEMIVPDAAHGTNPASAAMCGYTVKEVATNEQGDVDLEALKAILGPKTAGIMLTNPSTLGVFESNITTIAKMVHEAGGLLYYDGANLNAILGRVRPGDMGFDVMHMNLHKTFATPHGGGGPGAGPVAVHERLIPYLPVPQVTHDPHGYRWLTEKESPKTIGRVSTFAGNAGILLRAYLYISILGRDGLRRVSDFATLNANYLQARLQQEGFTLAYPHRRASHEFIITLKKESKAYDIKAMDVAKRLLDYGIHSPTSYFPLLVPECLLIEPTETEAKEMLDSFVEVMLAIQKEMSTTPDILRTAPHTLSVARLDDVKAAREPNLVFQLKSD